MAMLFVVIATTADDFFCPCCDEIAKIANMSESVAGVTILAFGNGSAEIFTCMTGVRGHPELVFAELFGSGMLLTTVVAGTICLMKPLYILGRPFLRDTSFYFMGVTWLICIFRKKYATSYETSGFLILYMLYFIVRKFEKVIRKRLDMRASILRPEEAEKILALTQDGPLAEGSQTRFSIRHHIDSEPYSSSTHGEIEPDGIMFGELLKGLNPIKKEDWNDSNTLMKILMIVQSPVVVILKIFIPTVDEAEINNGWIKPLNIMHCITMPLYTCWAMGGVYFETIYGIPMIFIMAFIGSVASACVYFTSKIHKPPRYQWVFAFMGFLGCVATMYVAASEIVALLKAIGLTYHISEATLGMTFMAWGNTLADCVTILAVVRAGFPRMGLASCFSLPVFNLLAGMGVAFTVESKRTGFNKVQGDLGEEDLIALFFLFVSLVSSFITFPLMRFYARPGYGIYLLSLYCAFLVTAFLNEINVIHFSV